MILTENQAVAIHTYDGVQVAELGTSRVDSMLWSRDLRDVSRCEFATSYTDDVVLGEITPWLHWASVWDMDTSTLLWTGPIQKVTSSRSALAFTARDVSTLMSRTRVPITKSWETADPSAIARELWVAMAEHHGLSISPIVRVDPEGAPFDFEVEADTKMLDAAMGDLTKLGLRWCVVAGVPVLGPVPLDPVTTLGENDFLGDVEVSRDGSGTYNDILVRGAEFSSRARVPLGGLNLQTIVNVDDLFGISNVDRAAAQYARHSAGVLDVLSVPGNTALRPDTPVSIDELLPGSRFIVDARGLQVLMELESVEVALDSGSMSVSVTLDSVVELPELAEIASSGAGGGLSL